MITILASWPWKVSTVPIRIYIRERYQDGEPSGDDKATNVSRDLDLSEAKFVVTCQTRALEQLFIAFIHTYCDLKVSQRCSDFLQLAQVSTKYGDVPGAVVRALFQEI
jgi:hypothetical protein